MKKLILIIIFSFCGILQAQDFKENATKSIFSDYKAHKIGDVITVIVQESSRASNEADMQSNRTSDIGFNASASMGASAMLPATKVGLGTNGDFEGGGKIISGGSFQTKISVTVDSVLANGLLRIKGKRKIVINEEEQNIEVKGLVRTSDILPDNSIFSHNISDAEIILEGDGMIGRNTSPGWITKFIHWLF